MSTARPDAIVGWGFLKLGAGEAAARGVAFAATVYLARELGASLYGTIVLATTVLLYVDRVSDCGIDLLGVREVAHEPLQLATHLSSFLGARVFVAVLVIIPIVVLGLLAFPQPDGAVLAALAFVLLPQALGTRWAHLGLEHSGIVSVSRAITEGATALLIVMSVHGPGDLLRVPAIEIASESAGAYLLLRALPSVRLPLRTVFRPDVVLSLYRRSWPLVLNTLLGLVIFNGDFFFLRVYRDSATVGYYAAAYTLVSFFINLGQSYQLSLLPVMTRLLRDPEGLIALYQSATAQVLAGVLPLAVGGCLVAGRLMPAVFGATYLPSIVPLQILLWSVPVAMTRFVAQGVLIAHGRQDLMLRTAAFGAVSNLLLNLIIVRVWGMTGAAIVTVVTESIRTVTMLAFTRGLGMPMVSLRRFWRTFLAAGVMAVAILTIRVPSAWFSIALGGVVYVLALYAVGGVRVRRGALPELMV